MSILKNIFIFFINIVKNILAPKICFFCGKEGSFLCEDCFNKQDNFKGFCYICKRKSDDFKIHKKCLIENKILNGKNFNDKKIYLDRVIVMAHYKNNVIKKLIKYFKFFGKKDIGKELGEKLGIFVKNNISLLKREYPQGEGFGPVELNNFVVIPVPLHFFKKIKRGFNQSEILGESFSKILNIDYSTKVLIRKKYTRQQSKLNKIERLKNLDNAFIIKVNKVDIIDNKIIFLVDDVISTGTTLNEIAKILKQNGAKKVIGVCVASN
ncbi:MAG: ComF family protein [Candidatus Gracilibacteria bacterium]|nr:ComF family protein [Candidatus Gracilibacteria bacterium]MDQ7022310.1 ComF family protein [Candidatus Gracilibacteria bacterium]